MISLQIRGYGPLHDGALLCPSCTVLHGRSDNAVFPLIYLHRATGDKRYLDAARLLFQWQERLINPDGSVYNDGHNEWKAITVFSCIGFCKTILYLGDALDDDLRAAVMHRITQQADWIDQNLTPLFPSNINYCCAAAAALALCALLVHRDSYRRRSQEMLRYCMEHFTENGLLMGEGRPHDGRTSRGCRLVDIGYNFEESIPCLTDAAKALGEEETLRKLACHMMAALDLFLPDGGIDNSFGTRNNKWTYYGSRTSDGCAAALITLSAYAPPLREAALRNVELQMACTHNGLLYGGRQYFEAGQKPCVHHTICHAVGLADALIAGLAEDRPRASLPCDENKMAYRWYPEIATVKIWAGPWLATVTGCDNQPDMAGSGGLHASGGTVSMLFHKSLGPVIAGSTYVYSLSEPLNMQLPDQRFFRHSTLIPRAEITIDGAVYASCLDPNAQIASEAAPGCVRVTASSRLFSPEGSGPAHPAQLKSEFVFKESSAEFILHVDHPGAVYRLPLIGSVTLRTNCRYCTENIFYLSGGFMACEYILYPDADGYIRLTLS